MKQLEKFNGATIRQMSGRCRFGRHEPPQNERNHSIAPIKPSLATGELLSLFVSFSASVARRCQTLPVVVTFGEKPGRWHIFSRFSTLPSESAVKVNRDFIRTINAAEKVAPVSFPPLLLLLLLLQRCQLQLIVIRILRRREICFVNIFPVSLK